MKKRVLSGFLSVSLLFTLMTAFPTAGVAAKTSTNVYVGDCWLSQNQTMDGVYWDAANSTINIKNINVVSSKLHEDSAGRKIICGIYADGDINIMLENNTSNFIDISNMDDNTVYGAYGIYATGDIKIYGGGSINVKSAVIRNGSVSAGVFSEKGDITVDNASVTAFGGTMKENSCKSTGIGLNNGTITIKNAAVVNATGGIPSTEKTYTSQMSCGILIDDGKLICDNCTLNANGGKADSISAGIYADKAEISFTGKSVVNVTGDEANGSEGVSAGIYSNGSVSFDDQNVNLKAVQGVGKKLSTGLRVDSLTAKGGKLDAVCLATIGSAERSAIYALNDINIGGSAYVYANSGLGTSKSNTIYTKNGDIKIDGTAHVEAAAEDVRDDSYTKAVIQAESGGMTVGGSAVVLVDSKVSAKQDSVIYGIKLANDLKVGNKASLTVKNGYSNGKDSDNYGIYAKNVEVADDGNLEVNCRSANNLCYGIFADVDVYVSGGKLKITVAESDTKDSYGIYAKNQIYFVGGESIVIGRNGAVSKQPKFSIAYQKNANWYMWKGLKSEQPAAGYIHYSDKSPFVNNDQMTSIWIIKSDKVLPVNIVDDAQQDTAPAPSSSLADLTVGAGITAEEIIL